MEEFGFVEIVQMKSANFCFVFDVLMIAVLLLCSLSVKPGNQGYLGCLYFCSVGKNFLLPIVCASGSVQLYEA